jgi:hypothetical protein
MCLALAIQHDAGDQADGQTREAVCQIKWGRERKCRHPSSILQNFQPVASNDNRVGEDNTIERP